MGNDRSLPAASPVASDSNVGWQGSTSKWFSAETKAEDQKPKSYSGYCSTSSSLVDNLMGKVLPSVDMVKAKIRARADDLRQQQGIGRRLALFIVPPSGGAVAFGATLLASQAAGAAAGVSCASPVLASLMGCISICSASAASAQVSYSIRRLYGQTNMEQADAFVSKENLVVGACFGMILYKVLGGRYRNLMPSNVANPGALARASIPARGRKYANKAEQKLIQVLYRKHGCHHCGNRTGSSIADHMPPNVIAHGRGWAKEATPTKVGSILARLLSAVPLPIGPKVVDQRFYPQCTSCTNIQSAALRHGKQALIFHFRRGIPEVPYFTGLCIGTIPVHELYNIAEKKPR